VITPLLYKEVQLTLNTFPESILDELFSAFDKIISNYRTNHWEPSELNGGKFCEVVYSMLSGYLCGSIPGHSTKPNNMYDACKSLEMYPSTQYPRSLRIQIPRSLTVLYEVRNNRGVGHVGGDVIPNKMDALFVVNTSKWVLAEILRVFGDLPLDKAQSMVDSLVEKEYPWQWEVHGKHRILKSGLSKTEQTLLLLYSSNLAIPLEQLLRDVEYTNSSLFKDNIIKKLHKDRLIEYISDSRAALISPKGISIVEETILPKVI
jgi:hypothetical protein